MEASFGMAGSEKDSILGRPLNSGGVLVPSTVGAATIGTGAGTDTMVGEGGETTVGATVASSEDDTEAMSDDDAALADALK